MVASGERSFIKRKLIKIHGRSTMTDDGQSSLAILSTENEMMQILNFDCRFSEIKAKKFKF